MGRKCLQFGCGLSTHPAWLNYDASPRLYLERSIFFRLFSVFGIKPLFPKDALFGNIVDGLSEANESFDLIYSSHVIEHLARSDARTALENCYKLLKPGGKLKLVLPDLEWRINKYMSEQDLNVRADIFMTDTLLGIHSHDKGLLNALRALFGHSQHLWMYDFHSLSNLLNSIGYREVKRSGYGQSDEEELKFIEAKDRFWQDGYDELAIEAYK